ncbi:glycosyltransferase [Pseudohongiella spirulinae]|uniref:Glycosyl transferase family 1 n=1 Tax=Pseudohongiella spirulinae TaxID=1249552 RepID=A0A0S2KAJ4_9GAMM|nr:glycosyltransferase [Pseudohongiella spirulinae]ALO45107.1 glycosyl transferase family 1 [Pseudohongiella spirulinae]
MTTADRYTTKPKVSVICRTLFRDTLARTLESVNRQSWPIIQLVLVDASGEATEIPTTLDTHVEITFVSSKNHLDRPAAANAGLNAATGQYLLFLDDDDWIADDHIARLIEGTNNHKESRVVYSGTCKVDPDGNPTDDVIAVPFDITALRRDNFIPIHSALFHRSLIDEGCHFDESLSVYEDWDFWLQCAELTSFRLLDYTGAFYRIGGDSQTMLEEHAQRYQAGHIIADARARVLDKWRLHWTGEQLNAVMGLIDQTPALNNMHDELKMAHRLIGERDQQVKQLHDAMKIQQADFQSQLARLQKEFQYLQSAHTDLNLAHEQLDQDLREILNSFSWRAMAPYRYLRHRLNHLLAQRPRHVTTVDTPNAINADIVLPADNSQVYSSPFTVQAWAWSPHRVTKIEVALDSLKLRTITQPIHYATLGDAQRIGFTMLIDTDTLETGRHQLTLHIHDDLQNTLEIKRGFVYRDPVTVYNRWLEQSAAFATNTGQYRRNEPIAPLAVLLNAADFDRARPGDLAATLNSLTSQTENNWQLFLIGSADMTDYNTAGLTTHHFQTLPEALDENFSYLIPLRPGIILQKNYLQSLVDHASEQVALLYCDHDHVHSDGRRSAPWFTWHWSPELLAAQNYIGDTFAIHRRLLKNETTVQTTDDWPYTLLCELAPAIYKDQVVRIASMLWSDTMPPKSMTNEINARPTQPAIEGRPRVSIIIPTTGNLTYLKPCLDTLANSDYPELEVIVLDNSRGKHPEGIEYAQQHSALVIECNEPFNWSRLNNTGADRSTGELLLFLNDDIEITHADWLHHMVHHALKDDVGTVGAMLLYPNGSIQHAGVFLVDHGGGARHLFHRQLPGKGIYQQLDQCDREVSANTGACLLIRRDRFYELGQFDEKLPIVGNDIDLCLRCLDAGLRNIWTPASKLIHHESVSRKSKPIGKDEKSMWQRWGHKFKEGDPYYNPNLPLNREDCSLAELPIRSDQSLGPGVNMVAYIRASMGVGQAARGNAAGLQAAGIPFGIINYERGNPSKMDNLQWQHKEIREPIYEINLIHINADHIGAAMADIGMAKFAGKYNIGFWAWEMQEFPDRWLGSFDLLDEIWVPSAFVNSAIAEKSPIPVITIPHIVDVDMQGARRYPRDWFGIEEHVFVFVSMFDTHSIAQRKNPFGSIRAFQKAFDADDSSVCLVVKINNADQSSIKILKECIADYRNIILIDKHFDRAQTDSLINCADCYVSLHHSEGFGYGPAEAMFMGKVALLTNWSGNTEYMRADNCVAIQYELKRLNKDYGPYDADQFWAIPDIGHAAEEMAKLAGNPERARTIGEHAKQTIAMEFSPKAIGERMKKRLLSIARIRNSNKR